MSSKFATPRRTHTRPTVAPIGAQRQVTPNRGNKNSLPNKVCARLILDVEAVDSQIKTDFTGKFKWHPEFDGFRTDPVRNRFYYYRNIKCSERQNLWQATVDWAKEILMSKF